jgi:hypothetical protein
MNDNQSELSNMDDSEMPSPEYITPVSQPYERKMETKLNSPTKKQPVQSQEQRSFVKSESESMHKLIRELNDQALGILYSQNQNYISSDSQVNEYIVIQRKLSEMKSTVLDEPVSANEPTDLQKSINILEKAQKILQVQREKQQLVIKPIYSSIIDYNIACCNQQLNNLKECDKLLG